MTVRSRVLWLVLVCLRYSTRATTVIPEHNFRGKRMRRENSSIVPVCSGTNYMVLLRR